MVKIKRTMKTIVVLVVKTCMDTITSTSIHATSTMKAGIIIPLTRVKFDSYIRQSSTV